MSLLNFNRNNSGRTWDGKESTRGGAIDRVKWEMREDELVYKYPYDNLTNGTILIVNDSQKAFLFKNGTLYDSFGAGSHQLTTANIPLLQRILNAPTGGETAFTAEVWFVNTEVEKRNMLWGAGGLRIYDPYFDISIKVGARGAYGIKISEPELFLKKMVGSMHYVTTDKIFEQFSVDIVQGIKVHLHQFMKDKNLNINELGREYENIGVFVQNNLRSTFGNYGIDLLGLRIEDINIDESDPSYIKVMDGKATGVSEMQRLNALGDKYAEVRKLNILEKAAENEGSGNILGAGLGLGAGLNLGQMFVTQNVPQHNAPPPPPPVLAEFHLTHNGQTSGPYSLSQLQEFARQNIVTADSLLWKNGMAYWEKAMLIPELSFLFRSSPPPPPPPPSI